VEKADWAAARPSASTAHWQILRVVLTEAPKIQGNGEISLILGQDDYIGGLGQDQSWQGEKIANQEAERDSQQPPWHHLKSQREVMHGFDADSRAAAIY
jgi:hypothetical protein